MAHRVDSLPYVDLDLDRDPKLKQNVDNLVEAEIVRAGGRDALEAEFLAQLDPLPQETRLNASLESSTGIDLSRYDLSTPCRRPQVEMAAILLEYEQMSKTNLQVMKQVGSHTWVHHRSQLEEESARLESLCQQHKTQIDQVNQDRQRFQKDAKAELDELNERWGSLCFSAGVLRHQVGMDHL